MKGNGWYSFDHKDVHFVGLNNTAVLEGMGNLGEVQLSWLDADLKGQPASRPVVVFAHIPLWSVYPDWGWGTRDSEQALSFLKWFESVTVLNGHIHQVMQKVEGAVTFHTAMSTASPQPAPGTAKNPGPLQVPDEKPGWIEKRWGEAQPNDGWVRKLFLSRSRQQGLPGGGTARPEEAAQWLCAKHRVCGPATKRFSDAVLHDVWGPVRLTTRTRSLPKRRNRAIVLMKSDPTLGALQLEEADKLRPVLAYLLPR